MAALDGMRVMDLSQYESGPSCTQALAWMGADVVKVERPGAGDPGRDIGGLDDYFKMWNSNKRSVTLALETESGRETLLKMLPQYDVFVENYGPGVVEKLRIDYEDLKAVHPEIIYARVKGFGSDGPYSQYKCFDMVAQAAAGAFSVTGEADGPPMRPGATVGDAGTGTQLAMTILAAYVQRLRTGEGQLVELSMQEAMTYYMRTTFSSSAEGTRVVGRTGNGNDPLMTLYPCAPGGKNDYVFIMPITQRMWEDMATAIGRRDLLEDPRFTDPMSRIQHRSLLFDEIAAWTRQHDKHEAMKLLAEAGVPVSAILTSEDIYNDPHLLARGFIQEVETESGDSFRLPGFPARMSRSRVDLEAAAALGKHTREVISADLGLSETEFDSLGKSGAFG